MTERKEWAHTLEIELIEGKGVCAAGHSIGDRFIIPGDTEQFRCSGLCIHALGSMLPKIVAMRYGADFPWLRGKDPDRSTHLCPDAANPHVFKIRRVRSDEGEKAGGG